MKYNNYIRFVLVILALFYTNIINLLFINKNINQLLQLIYILDLQNF